MRFAILLATAVTVDAGVIQGVVLEQASGVPLARTVVRLQPVEKAGGGEVRPTQVRADKSGHFEFGGVSAGLYLVTAIRANYFPASFGQRRPNGQGLPVEVTSESNLFVELRMKRRGVITGKVMDENGVGIEKVSVLAYRARQPVRLAAQAESDDRGIYRIRGLDPGKYWIRTTALVLEDGAPLMPTFGSEAREIHDARVHEVRADTETQYADVRPEFGSLFRLRGRIQCRNPNPPFGITVTVTSDTGRRTTQTSCPTGTYQVEGLGPGDYEIFAARTDGSEYGFNELFLDRDSEGGSLTLAAPNEVRFFVRRPGAAPDNRVPPIIARRVDPFGPDTEREITTPQAILPPGHWEMKTQAGAGQYVESIANTLARLRREVTAPPGWFPVPVSVSGEDRVRITFSDQTARITGTVAEQDKGVAGIPVFLWPLTGAGRRSVGSIQVLSDTEGKYIFEGLPPGDYRLLATFDLSEVDEDVLNEARAVTIRLDAAQTATVGLTPWNAQ